MGFICMNSGVKVRAALTTAITRKAIGLGYISADNASRVVSFMANDINKIYDGMQVWAVRAAFYVCVYSNGNNATCSSSKHSFVLEYNVVVRRR